MSKKISIVSVNQALVEWLQKQLAQQVPSTKEGQELAQAFKELAAGASSSLLLEMDSGGTSADRDVIRSGELAIYPAARKVVRGEEEIFLTPKEFDILLFLARNRGEVFTKEQIYHAVWDRAYLIVDSNIMAFIRKLRKKIEPYPDDPRYILTIWGIGYKFTDEE